MDNKDVKTEPAKTPEPKKAETPAPKKIETYIVTGSVKHNGEIYVDGDPIDLDAKTAEELLAVGAVREFRKKDS